MNSTAHFARYSFAARKRSARRSTSRPERFSPRRTTTGVSLSYPQTRKPCLDGSAATHRAPSALHRSGRPLCPPSKNPFGIAYEYSRARNRRARSCASVIQRLHRCNLHAIVERRCAHLRPAQSASNASGVLFRHRLPQIG